MTQKAKRLRGRPFLPSEARRETTIQIRVSRQQRKALEEKAKLDGKKLSDWARNILLTYI